MQITAYASLALTHMHECAAYLFCSGQGMAHQAALLEAYRGVPNHPLHVDLQLQLVASAVCRFMYDLLAGRRGPHGSKHAYIMVYCTSMRGSTGETMNPA